MNKWCCICSCWKTEPRFSWASHIVCFVFVCFVNNAAAELPDGDPRERSSHQGSGGEGGFPGSWGQELLRFIYRFIDLLLHQCFCTRKRSPEDTHLNVFNLFLSAEPRNAWPHGVLPGRPGPSAPDWEQARGCLQVSNHSQCPFLLNFLLIHSTTHAIVKCPNKQL